VQVQLFSTFCYLLTCSLTSFLLLSKCGHTKTSIVTLHTSHSNADIVTILQNVFICYIIYCTMSIRLQQLTDVIIFQLLLFIYLFNTVVISVSLKCWSWRVVIQILSYRTEDSNICTIHCILLLLPSRRSLAHLCGSPNVDCSLFVAVCSPTTVRRSNHFLRFAMLSFYRSLFIYFSGYFGLVVFQMLCDRKQALQLHCLSSVLHKLDIFLQFRYRREWLISMQIAELKRCKCDPVFRL